VEAVAFGILDADSTRSRRARAASKLSRMGRGPTGEASGPSRFVSPLRFPEVGMSSSGWPPVAVPRDRRFRTWRAQRFFAAHRAA
jgi:hypothetical protein